MTDTAAGNYHPNEKDGTCGQYLGTGYKERRKRALGGDYAKRGELPYQAALGYRNRRGQSATYKCGGTLINRYIRVSKVVADHSYYLITKSRYI